MEIIITTAQNYNDDMVNKGLYYEEFLQGTFVLRENLNNLKDDKILYIVLTKTGLVCHYLGQKFFYHPSMAMLRIKRIKDGEEDIFTTICGDIRGFKILDCTMGFASDALVWSYLVTEKGHVTALEKNKVIYGVITDGLKSNYEKWWEINKYGERIETLNYDYSSFLSNTPDGYYDIVYFDPMFDKPLEKSIHLQPLRLFAESSSLTKEIIQEGKRVAKKFVIVKNNRNYNFTELGINEVVGKKSSKVKYGVISL